MSRIQETSPNTAILAFSSTNDKGEFVLSIETNLDSAELRVSQLGYKTQTFKLSTIDINSPNLILIVQEPVIFNTNFPIDYISGHSPEEMINAIIQSDNNIRTIFSVFAGVLGVIFQL